MNDKLYANITTMRVVLIQVPKLQFLAQRIGRESQSKSILPQRKPFPLVEKTLLARAS